VNTSKTMILEKANVESFFDSVGQEMQLVAPTVTSLGDAAFDVVKSASQIAWDYGHALYPPKEFFLPLCADMFRYRNGEQLRLQNRLDRAERALIGVRSCDVEANRRQERFFGHPIEDPYFKARSENTVMFSLVCNKPPKKECFCICCDAGPYLDGGFDVQLTDLGDRFLYEIGSDKGVKVTAPRMNMLSEASPEDLEARRRIELEADSLFDTVGYIAKAINFISENEVPPQVWEELGAECFGCGSCTHLCPVCTCFTVEDTERPDGWVSRCRIWDSCQYSGFTQEASGHNPRATYGDRVKRRLFHKASYQYVMRDGWHGCVGCGRCVTSCLADLGLPSVIKRIRRAMHDYLEPRETPAEV
jgi:sulfhydrogenase subunit beta (sulfur reductase)